MARAYTVSTSKFWDDVFFNTTPGARQGGDTYTINSGAILTIDTDTRTCLYSTEGTGCFGQITADEGQLFIDATAVRILAFDAGDTGTAVPAKGTTLYDDTGAAYGECLGVWTDLASAPKAHGSDMWPATGYIKFRSLTGSFADNAQVRTATGGGGAQVATANGIDRVGWLEIAGVEGSNIAFGGSTSGTLGSFKTRGAWFAVGTTPATPATTDTYQLPASYTNTNFGGVWVDGVHWPNAGNIAANTLATDARGRVCWISASGLLRFGSDGTNTGGELPPANAAITIPNIILLNTNTTVTTGFTVGANAALNATFATRYDITLTAGRLDLEYLTGGWAMAAGGADYTASHCSFLDTYSVSSTFFGKADLTDIIVGYSGVGTPPTNVMDNISLTGGTWQDVTVVKGAASQVCRFLVATGFNVTNFKLHPLVARSSAISCLYMDGANYNSFVGLTLINGVVTLLGIGNEFTDTVYCDTLIGTVGTANPQTIFLCSGGSADTLVDGISWLISTANTCHPYNYFMNVDRSVNNRLRNIGSAAAPLDCGSVNVMAAQYNAGNTATLLKVDRVYTSDLRVGLNNYGTSNSLLNAFASNLWGGSGDAFSCTINNNSRGIYGNPDVATTVAGAHFGDGFQSATAGKIVIYPGAPLTIEPSLSAVAITAGAPVFTGASVYMPVVGDQVTWRFPYKLRGYTAFNGAPTFSAGTFANFLTEYSLDLGVTWKTADATNLNAETLPDPAVGFNLWVRVTCSTASTSKTTNGVVRIVFAMTTTAGAQANQYALEEITFTDSRSDGVSDASVAWVDPAGTTVFGFYTGTGTEVTYQNEDGTEKTGTYISRRAGYGEFVGGWTETTSWYLDTKVYFIAQTLIEATIADSGGITFVGDTSATLGANKTFQQLYSNAQHWSCLEANMLHAIPVVSAGAGAYTANVDVVATGYTLNGSGSLAMGSNTLTANDSFSYTYTGGTFSQAAAVPSFAGGTLNIGAAGAYTYTQAAAMILSMTPTAPGTYALGDTAFTGEVDLRNTSVTHAITVELPSGTSYTTANNTGAAITISTPQLYQSVVVGGIAATYRIQIFDLEYVFTISGVTVTPTAGATYTNNGTTYTVRSTNITAGSGTVTMWGTAAPESSGTLTKASGTGDATLAFSAVAVDGTELYIGVPGATSYTWTDGTPAADTRVIRIRIMEDGPGTSDAIVMIDKIVGTCGTSSGTEALTYLATSDIEADDVYNDRGVDGSAITGITIDDTTLRLEIASGTITNYNGTDVLVVDGRDLYAYETYWLGTTAGMRDEARFIEAIDAVNFRCSNFKMKGTSGYPIMINNCFIVDAATGIFSSMVDYSGDPISNHPEHMKAIVVTTSDSVVTGTLAEFIAAVPTANDIAQEVVTGITF